MKLAFSIVLIFISTINCWTQQENSLPKLVNPFIGTDGTGHTFPGATSPFGMVQLSPDTRNDDSWEGCSGYYYSDEKILGFSHTHLSGTGCSDYGDLLLMPFNLPTFSNAQKEAMSTQNHSKDLAWAGFYQTTLQNQILVKLTTTERTGIHSYSFPNNDNKQILIDLKHRDQLLNFEFSIPNDSTILGHRKSKAWASNQDFYFAIRFSSPFKGLKSNTGENIPLHFPYSDSLNHPILVLEFAKNTPQNIITRVGISQVDSHGALKNLEAEAKHNSFERYLKNNEFLWQKQLEKIEFQGKNANKDTLFYTALYHCMIAPNIASDIDGRYRGMDRKIHSANDYIHYTVFSLWDTYRALHPLFTIIERKRTEDFLKTFLNMFKHGGKLPVWELAANETNCMIGYHSVSVFADALAKGIPFDLNLACQAGEVSANQPNFGIQKYATQGYLQIEDEPESVSKTIEYSYDDYCLYKLFTAKGEPKKAQYYLNRSKGLFQLMDPETGLMRPRTNGGFIPNFDPYRVDNNYTEANAWQYSYSFAHHLPLFEKLSPQPLELQLDKIFTASTKTSGRSQADMTGLIGQYVQGNEPSHHIAYLYMFTNAPYKTQDYLSQIMESMFSTKPDGLPGNEDCGQMSAWYVFTALGFYPIVPGDNYYIFGKPFFKNASINLENGTKIQLKIKNPEQPYLNRVQVSKPFKKIGFTHDLFQKNDSIVYHMSPAHAQVVSENNLAEPSENWIPIPSIESESISFRDSILVNIKGFKNTRVYYALNNSKKFEPYTGAFWIKEKTKVQAYCQFGQDTTQKSAVVTKELKTYQHKDLYVDLLSKPLSSYFPGNGSDALVDGILGDAEWKKGNWIGFQGNDISLILKGNERKNSICFIRVLQEERSWIFVPKQANFTFYLKGKIVDEQDTKIERHNVEAAVHEIQIYTDKKFDSVKIILKYPGDISAPHPGAGHKSIQFIDEVGFK